MTGRNKFIKYKFLVTLVVSILSVFPNFILLFLWNFFNSWASLIGIFMRYCLLKVLLENCGDNVYIGPYVQIKNFKNISIGNNVSIHAFCYIDAHKSISIGDNVSIAHNCSVLDFNHTWQDVNIPIKYNKIITKEVIIMNDVWIGCGSRILMGVIVNSRSIIAAGSVINKNVEGNTIVGGVPGQKIRDIYIHNKGE